MTLIDHPRSSREEAWAAGERATLALMGTINLAVAQLVATIRMLIDTDGWAGHGIQSVEHWVTWKAGISRRRASRLTLIARRLDELPACWALFEQGRLTEDAMVRIAERVAAERDAEVASWAPNMLISQLRRALASCPERPEAGKRPPPRERERYLYINERPDGSGTGMFSLPAEEMAVFTLGLNLARDAEYRDRRGLDADAEIVHAGSVDWVDALVRLASEAADALDSTLARTGRRGERNQIVLHHDMDASGVLGPGQLRLGGVVRDAVARFLACDAQVRIAAYQAGALVGISPVERTVSRPLRLSIERRDQGCAHPMCEQRRWLHIHHIQHWTDGGPTVPSNLVALCSRHHRELHCGEFSLEGNPEDGTLRVLDGWGRPIAPPGFGPPGTARRWGPAGYTPPLAERLDHRLFGWN